MKRRQSFFYPIVQASHFRAGHAAWLLRRCNTQTMNMPSSTEKEVEYSMSLHPLDVRVWNIPHLVIAKNTLKLESTGGPNSFKLKVYRTTGPTIQLWINSPSLCKYAVVCLISVTVHMPLSFAIESAGLGPLMRRSINGLLNAGGFRPIN